MAPLCTFASADMPMASEAMMRMAMASGRRSLGVGIEDAVGVGARPRQRGHLPWPNGVDGWWMHQLRASPRSEAELRPERCRRPSDASAEGVAECLRPAVSDGFGGMLSGDVVVGSVADLAAQPGVVPHSPGRLDEAVP